ncbi:MAG: small multi-drug export protein, partial [Clostridia bacterium]|nr:small multi-drug export protein [Clostridia bacterium]
MTEKIIDAVRELIGNDFFTTVLISMIPIVELRGAIPAAITMGIKPLTAFALAWAGSAIVAPILLLILRPVLNWMKKYKLFASLARAIEDGFKSKAMKVMGKSGDGTLTGEELKRLERKKMFGVYLFVAFPIPLTGVWTGSAIATFIDIPFWKAMAMVWLGNLTAGAIVTLLAFFLSAYMNIILDVFFIIVILVLLLFIVRTAIKMVKNK